MRIPRTENPRFPEEGSSALGKSGPKARPKGVADGQQAEIPVPYRYRTAGTHGESASRERKARRKHRPCHEANPYGGGGCVTRSEITVAKSAAPVPRKAAIVTGMPVP